MIGDNPYTTQIAIPINHGSSSRASRMENWNVILNWQTVVLRVKLSIIFGLWEVISNFNSVLILSMFLRKLILNVMVADK